MKLDFNNYQETDNIRLYLRKNIIEEYLSEEEKKILKERHLRANKYILTSKEICEIEKDYMRYEEEVFSILYSKEVLIKKDDGISIFIEGPRGLNLELKEYLKLQNILVRKNDSKSQEEKLKILENMNKIEDIIF